MVPEIRKIQETDILTNTRKRSAADVNGIWYNEELSDDSAVGGMRAWQPHLLQGEQHLLQHLPYQQGRYLRGAQHQAEE